MSTDDPVIRPFAEWLREQADGRTHNELGETLHELVGRCRDTGKKGSMSLTITVEPSKSVDGMFVIKDAIKSSPPEFDRPASVAWTDSEGNLIRNDPKQLVLDGLREVPPPGVDPKTGEILTPATRKAN